MAIVQISRITNRIGLRENLPTYLAGGEIGWSADTQQLYIGNGRTGVPPSGDGAPFIGNTEILTEHSDILNIAGSYTYKGDAAGYSVRTGAQAGEDVERLLQSKLDDQASVRDFGAVGDGVVDDTAAINRAFYEIFCREDTTLTRRSLFFPAGTYRVSSTLLIPPYAKVFGEGVDSTVISYVCPEWGSNAIYNKGQGVINTVGPELSKLGRFRAVKDVPVGITTDNTEYWILVGGYIGRTTDNRQQTGANNGAGDRISSRYIEISSMSFVVNESFDTDYPITAFLIESADHCSFRNVGFAGPAVTLSELVDDADIETPLFPEARCVEFASPVPGSSTTRLTSSITLDTCIFSGQTTGIFSQDETRSITVSNSFFDTLFQGVKLTDAPSSVGPTGFRIVQNSFDTIWDSAIVFDGVARNISMSNAFYDVGNRNKPSPVVLESLAPCIIFNDANNVSWADMFDRSDENAALVPRVKLVDDIASLVLDQAEKIKFGTYTREAGYKYALVANTSTFTNIFVIETYAELDETAVPRAFRCEYTIIRGGAVRTGVIIAASGQIDNSSSSLVYYDEFTENTDTGIVLQLIELTDSSTQSNSIALQYTSDSGASGNILLSLSYLS